MGWPCVPLGALADGDGAFVDGPFGSNLKASEYQDAGVPIIRLQNIRPNGFLEKDIKYVSQDKASALNRHNYRGGDLVIAKLGDPCGMTCVVPDGASQGIIVADVVRFRGAAVDHCFLSYYLNSEQGRIQFKRLSKGTTRQRVNLSDIRKIVVPNPPLSEQRRIVDLLARAEGIVRLRREAERKAAELIPALFLDMFGDPATNPKGWAVKRLDSLCDLVRGSSPRPQGDPRFFGGPVPRLMIADITRDGVYVKPTIDSLTLEGAKKSRPMNKGEVVMAVSGAVGLPAILAIDACIHDGFVGFRSLDSSLSPGFFYNFLSAFRRHSIGQAVGATFQNLKTDQIREWIVPIPPPALQSQFQKTAGDLRGLEAQQSAATAKAQETFDALLGQVFSPAGAT